MAAIVLASNVGVQVLIADGWLTWGAFTYPLAFLVTDVTTRLMGAPAARRTVLAGFAVGLACSAVGTQIEGAYGPLVSWRVALGSAAAFLTAQMLDVAIFSALRRRRWWVAPAASTLVGGAVDTALFFTIAFSAALVWIEPGNDVSWAQAATVVGPLWVGMALADYAVKVGIGLLALAPFRWLTRRSSISVA
jgi:uncharacterized integral membrane protein (TIGR00697 family)